MVCSGSFVSPVDGATLTAADDLSKSCSGSLHTNISLATSADDGTNVDLYVNGTKVDTQKVSGAEVHFMTVQLAQGANMLQAVFSATCTLKATVNVNCNLPTCTITAPTLSQTHVALNGVPAANGGDRKSAAGSPYQVEFDVSTNIEDGQKVQLKVTPMGSTTNTVIEGTAVGGKVTFAGVTLVPDGNYSVEADCTNKAGVLGQSTLATYPVDTTRADADDLIAAQQQVLRAHRADERRLPGLRADAGQGRHRAAGHAGRDGGRRTCRSPSAAAHPIRPTATSRSPRPTPTPASTSPAPAAPRSI